MTTLAAWTAVSIGRFVELINGFAFPSSGFKDGEGMPLIRIRDLGRGETAVNFHGKFDERYLIKKGDLLIGMDGDFSTVRWSGGDALLNQRVCKLVTKDPECLVQEFLFYRIVEEINKIHRITAATTVKHLSSTDVVGIEIELPSKGEQIKIAEILSMIDRSIEQTEALIAKQQRIKTGLMQDLLTRGIDGKGNLRSEQTHKFKDSPLGRIPAEWELTHLEEIADVVDPQPDHRTPPEVRGGVPYIGLSEFTSDGTIDFDGARKISLAAFRKQRKSFSHSEGAFVFGKIGTIGHPKRLPVGRDYALSANVILVQPRETASFVYWWIESPIAKRLVDLELHTTSQPAFGIQKMRSFPMPKPSKDERKRLGHLLDQVGAVSTENMTCLQKLHSLKTSLMQDLLTGKKRVTSLLKPEPTH